MQDADQNVNWLEYFTSIQDQCPWSLRAYQSGLIDIRPWQNEIIPLGQMQARMYTLDEDPEPIAEQLESEGDEWLWSRPGCGPYATPVSVLIQQNAAELARLRTALGEE